MFVVPLPDENQFEAWRQAARIAITHNIPPDAIDWSGEVSLFETLPLPATEAPTQLRVSKAFLALAQNVMWHSSPLRFSKLYYALWRHTKKDGDPLSPVDVLGRELHLMSKSVGRDIHKMHAFVRFKEVHPQNERRKFAAWFEPEHHIVRPATPFFAKRFADMDWMIFTPRLSASFTNGVLSYSEGTARPHLSDDASEELWATYFANIFNPARVKLNAMRSEMPKKYWANLPETRLIPSMLADAERRVKRMQEAGASTARPGSQQISTRYRSAMRQPLQMPATIDEACAAAKLCQRCHLCETATQTVWGEGDPNAALMVVGEQPGDMEDLRGRPFVGPAGQILRAVIDDLRLDADTLYLTNAVKHFKFKPTGKRRLHANPNRSEIQHCRWWLNLEIGMVRPKVIVALGKTALYSLTSNDAPLDGRRGLVEYADAGIPVIPTWHPSYVLRTRDSAAAEKVRSELREDLQNAVMLATH